MVVGLVVMSAASGAYAAVRFTGETSKILPFEQLGLDGYPGISSSSRAQRIRL